MEIFKNEGEVEMEQQFENQAYHVVKTDKKLIEALKTDIGKVKWNIRDYANGKGEKIKDYPAYIDERIMVVFAKRVLNGGVNLPTQADSYGNITLYSEQKIHAHKKDVNTGLCPVISIKFYKNGPTMRIPYKITIELGEGKANESADGRITIASGTCKKKEDASMMLSQMDFENFFMEIERHYYAKAVAEELLKAPKTEMNS